MAVIANNYDVIVIGGGVAGFSAAITLNRRGKKVLILRKNTGASSVSSGAWDFGALEKPTSFQDMKSSESWQKIQSKLLYESLNPLFADGTTQALGDLTTDLGVAFSWEKPFCLPTSTGHWKHTYGAQKIQVQANLPDLKNRKVGLVHCESWRFRGDLVAKRLSDKVKIEPLFVDLKLSGPDWSLPRIAARLVHDKNFENTFKQAVWDRLEGVHSDVVLFPPLFLNTTTAATWEKEFRVPIAELLSTGEGVAGDRLLHAMEFSLQSKQIMGLEVDRVTPVTSGSEIKSLKCEGKEGAKELTAKSYVLATGKFFGGGIELGYPVVREAVFNLPVFHSRKKEPVSVRSQISFEDRSFFEEQNWAKLGVCVDAKWRPVDSYSKPVYGNLVACGSVIGGIDFARDNVGLGFMAYSGKRCADELA